MERQKLTRHIYRYRYTHTETGCSHAHVCHTHKHTNTYTDTHRAHEAKGSNKVKVTKLAKHNRKNKQ